SHNGRTAYRKPAPQRGSLGAQTSLPHLFPERMCPGTTIVSRQCRCPLGNPRSTQCQGPWGQLPLAPTQSGNVLTQTQVGQHSQNPPMHRLGVLQLKLGEDAPDVFLDGP